MKVIENFYNKVLEEIDSIYFPNLEWYRDNENCAKVHYLTELFSNGCITYNKYIKQVSKKCKVSENIIDGIVSKYVEIWN